MSAFIGFGLLGIFWQEANQLSPLQAAICLGVFGGVFLLVGLVVSLSGIRQLKRAQESAKWPAAPGKITSALVSREERTERDSSSGNVRSDATFFPRLQFAYEVGGANYTSNQRVIGGTEGFSTQERAEEVIEKYPTGKTVNVYYDPSDPQTGVLEPGVNSMPVWWLGVGVAIAIVGLGIFWMMAQMVIRA